MRGVTTRSKKKEGVKEGGREGGKEGRQTDREGHACVEEVLKRASGAFDEGEREGGREGGKDVHVWRKSAPG